MFLIDSSYFIGELTLPNIPVQEAASGGVALALQTVGENNLDVFANKYIVEYLICLFGRELTIKFIEEIKKPTPDTIWTNIKDQLLIEIDSYKASPLANYVYYWVRRAGESKLTQGGVADPDFDFAQNVSNRRETASVWNNMADMTIAIDKWFRKNIEDYKDYYGDLTGRDVRNITGKINEYGI